MELKKNLKALSLIGALTVAATPALADSPKCEGSISTSYKNELRFDSGATAFDGPALEGILSGNCGNLDAFVWGAQNIDTGKTNEVDFGLGYSLSEGNFSARAGVENWQYLENGGSDTAFTASVGYTGFPVKIDLKATKVIGDGMQFTLTGSKTIDLGEANGFTFSATPFAKTTYLEDYFGVSGHSNDIVGASLDISKGPLNTSLFVKQHSGNNDFGNLTEFGLSVNYKF